MVYLRMAWRSLRKSLFSNLLTVLQLAAALLVTAVMVSAVCLRFRKYTPFRDFYNSRGYLLQYPFFMEYGEKRMQVAAEKNEAWDSFDATVNSQLSAPLEAICPQEAPFWLGAPPKHDRERQPQITLYTEDFLRRWTPELAAGEWLHSGSSGDVLEAVVTWNDDEWQVGDTVTGAWTELDETGSMKKLGDVQIKIIGMLADGEAIAGQTGENTHDFRLFWRPHSYEREQDVQMFISAEQVAALCPTKQLTQFLGKTILLRYTEPVTEEQAEKDYKTLTWNSNSMQILKMEDIRENSRTFLYSEVYKLLPVIIMLMVLVMISSISSTALSTRRRLHDYAVFALSGLPWQKCIVINLLQSLMTAGAAAAAALICGAVLQHTSLRELFYVKPGGWQLLSCAAVIGIYLLISLWMPHLMLRKNSVREILKSN